MGNGQGPLGGGPAALRQLARRIGWAADDLEDLERYQEADELRGVAGRLREAARAESAVP